MFEEKEEKGSVFEGPIEKGETGFLPAEPEPGQEVTSDCFLLESSHFPHENLISIMLPKFLMTPTKVVSEQSFLLLTYEANHAPSIFKTILEASKTEIEKFLIHFKNSEDSDTISTWSFEGVRVHAIDFGYTTKKRTEPAHVSIELAFEGLKIDNFLF